MPSTIGKCKLFRIKRLTLLVGETFLRNKHEIVFFEIKCTFFGRKENTISVFVYISEYEYGCGCKVYESFNCLLKMVPWTLILGMLVRVFSSKFYELDFTKFKTEIKSNINNKEKTTCCFLIHLFLFFFFC